MASPPFSISETVPGDSDVASQFPAIERSFRDTVESWLLIDHNNMGRHDWVTLDWQDDPSAPGSEQTVVWASKETGENGTLKVRSGSDGDIEYVGVPPGTVLWFAGTTPPNGYLWANGAKKLIADYPRLYAVTGNVHDSDANGVTEFNLPDVRGRFIVGYGDDTLTSGSETFAAWIGSNTTTLITANLPSHSHGVNDPGHTHGHSLTGSALSGVGGASIIGGGSTYVVNNASLTINSASTGISIQNTGSGAAFSRTPSSIVLLPIIKY